MVDKVKVSEVGGTKSTDSASGWSNMLCLAMLALLAYFFVLVVDFLGKLNAEVLCLKLLGDM